MKKISEVIDILEKQYPLDSAENWDNSGWQVKDTKMQNLEIKTVIICITVDEKVIEKAIENDIKLIVAHHPCIFPSYNTLEDEILKLAVKNDIQIYSLHTNFDKALNGTTEMLAKQLGFINFDRINDFMVLHKTEKELCIDDIILNTKIALNCEKIKITNYKTFANVKNIAICAGAGGDFIKELNEKEIDLYITSDIKYHDALNAKNFMILDVGHYESEKPSLKTLQNLLNENGIDTIIPNEKKAWIFV